MATAANQVSDKQEMSVEIGTAVRHSFIYGLGGVLVKLLGFLLLPFYTHYLSPRDYGVIEVLDTSMSLLGMFLNMGMMAALLRYYGAAQNDEERRKVVGTVFVFTVSTALLVLGMGAVVVPKVSHAVLGPHVPAIYFMLSFCNFVLGYVGNIPFAYLRAKESSGRVVVIDTLATLGILLLSVAFIAIFKMALLGMFLSPLIVGVVRLGVLIEWTHSGMSFAFDWVLLRRILRFGLPLIFANLTMFTLNFSDRFFLQRLTSLDVVGIYAVGYKFAYMINFLLVQSFNMMWQARMYQVYKRPDHQQVFAQVFVLYSFLLIFAGLGLSLVSTELIRFMADARYAAGAQIVGTVTLAYVFLGIGSYLQLAMFLGHRTGLIGIVSSVAAIINLGANYFLISYFGMMGAAVATLIGFLAMAIGSYYGSERVLPMRLPVGRVWLGLCVAILVYLLGRELTVENVRVAIMVKCLWLAGFALVVRLWLLSREEVATVESLGHSAAMRVVGVMKSGLSAIRTGSG